MPTSFLEGYISQDFVHHDPALTRAVSTNAPFLWAACPEFGEWMRPRRRVRSKAQQVLAFAQDHGYTEGYLLPLHAVDHHGHLVSAAITFFWQHDPSCLVRPEVTPAWLRLVLLRQFLAVETTKGKAGSIRSVIKFCEENLAVAVR